jgi:hypothetical protein
MGLRFSSMRIRQQSSRMPLRTDLECLNFLIFFFDLSDLIQLVANLKGLVAPFQHDEVDNIVKELKSGKSLGPDGFNNDFMKKYWIQEDFDDPCSSFLTIIFVCKVSMVHILLSFPRWIIQQKTVILDQFHAH